MQAFWFYVAFILLVLATALHNPMGGYAQDQFYLRRIEVQTPFPSAHEYFRFWYSDETVRDNGLKYLRMGKDGEALAASGIGAEVIGARMREEYKKYEQHRQADREKEERWVRDMERNGWQRGKYLNDDLTRPQRWFTDPRGWNSNRPIAVSCLPDLTNLSSYLVSIAAILSLTGILGWLAGVRAHGNKISKQIEGNSSGRTSSDSSPRETIFARAAAQSTTANNRKSINWKMLSIGFVLFLIVVCVGLFRSAVVLGEKYPRLTTDDFWSIVTTFAPAVFGFSISFWLECSIGKQTKAKKAVYWLAFALIAWGGWFIFPPDMLSAALLGGALACFVESIVLVAVVTWPIRYVAESLARRIKFLNDLEIYKMIQYSLIATWLLL